MDNCSSIIMFQDLISYFFKLLRTERNFFFKDLPITPTQYDVLSCLNQKNLNLSAMSETLLLDSSTLVGIIDRLEKKGWIKKKVNPNDRRKNILSISEKGKEIYKNIPMFVSNTLSLALSNLKESEKYQLNRYVCKIIGIMESSNETTEDNSPLATFSKIFSTNEYNNVNGKSIVL